MSWLWNPSLAAYAAGIALKSFGHSVTATDEEEGMFRCRHCPVSLSTFGMNSDAVAAALRDEPSLRERCPGEMYRPIPGTPWFEYGPAKERS